MGSHLLTIKPPWRHGQIELPVCGFCGQKPAPLRSPFRGYVHLQGKHCGTWRPWSLSPRVQFTCWILWISLDKPLGFPAGKNIMTCWLKLSANETPTQTPLALSLMERQKNKGISEGHCCSAVQRALHNLEDKVDFSTLKFAAQNCAEAFPRAPSRYCTVCICCSISSKAAWVREKARKSGPPGPRVGL